MSVPSISNVFKQEKKTTFKQYKHVLEREREKK